MSEYIITDKQLKTATEAYLEHELSRPITDVYISGDKLPQIVRCQDCKHFKNDSRYGAWCGYFDSSLHDDYDGFCAWGERRDA